MARPADRDGLLRASQDAFDRLFQLVQTVPESERTSPGVNGDWSVKDTLTHLHAWHNLMETWYREGMAGHKPAMPALGYTWRTTPDLNERIFREHRHEPMDLVVNNLRTSHSRMHTLIENHSDEELFTKKRYSWTGSTSMGSCFVSATSSHYSWAIALIRRWLSARSKT
jgi:hypothetical protein